MLLGLVRSFFYTFREGNVAYTLQRSSNSFGLFLLLTELKVGGSRRSIIIPEGRAKNGWRVFGLELRKMLEPENYVNGGFGQSKFVAQPFKAKSGVQSFKTYADTVRGHQVQDRGRTNMGEKQNPVIVQRRLSKTPVNLPGPMTLGGRVLGPQHSDVDLNLGETNPVGNIRSFPLKFKTKVNDSVFGNDWELRKAHWTREGLTVEVNEEGKRRVAWNSYKGRLRPSKWVIRRQKEHIMVGPPNGSREHKNPVIGSAHFRRDVGTSNKGSWRNSKWGIRNLWKAVVGPSSGSGDQCLCPSVTQTGLGSFQSNKLCFSGPSVYELGESSSMNSPTSLAHLKIPLLPPSDKPEALRPILKVPERQVELPLLVGCSGPDGISSDSLAVAGIGAGYNSDGLTARPSVGFINGLERKSSDSTAVDGLELGTIYDGRVVALMVVDSFFSAGFLSNSHEVAQMGAIGCSTDGFNSVDFTQGLGRTVTVNSQLFERYFLSRYP